MKNLSASLLTDLLGNHPIKDVSKFLVNNAQVAMKLDEMAGNENTPRPSGATRTRKGIFPIYDIRSDLRMWSIVPILN